MAIVNDGMLEYLGTGEEAPAAEMLALLEKRKNGSALWYGGATVELIDRVTGETVAIRPQLDSLTRTLVGPGTRDEVTVTGFIWGEHNAEISELVEVRRADGITQCWYMSRVGLALRYTSGKFEGHVHDYTESYWIAYDAQTGRELIPAGTSSTTTSATTGPPQCWRCPPSVTSRSATRTTTS